MRKLTAIEARKLTHKAEHQVYDNLQDIVDHIVTMSKSCGGNTFIDLEPKNLQPMATELEERGFRVWIREDKSYLEVEW